MAINTDVVSSVRIVLGNRVDYVFTIHTAPTVKLPERNPIRVASLRVQVERETEVDNWFAVTCITFTTITEEPPAYVFTIHDTELPDWVSDLVNEAVADATRSVKEAR